MNTISKKFVNKSECPKTRLADRRQSMAKMSGRLALGNCHRYLVVFIASSRRSASAVKSKVQLICKLSTQRLFHLSTSTLKQINDHNVSTTIKLSNTYHLSETRRTRRTNIQKQRSHHQGHLHFSAGSYPSPSSEASPYSLLLPRATTSTSHPASSDSLSIQASISHRRWDIKHRFRQSG